MQSAFVTNVLSLFSAIEEVGNPFEDQCVDLLVLDTKKVVDTIKNITQARW